MKDQNNRAKDLKVSTIQNEIERAAWRVDFYSKTEEDYRTGKVKLPELSLHKLIRGAKKKRKQAQADLEYWQAELKKVA